MSLRYRALVCPGSGHLSGQWFAAVKVFRDGQPEAMRVLGQDGVGTWEHAAMYAIREARDAGWLADACG